VIVGGVEALRWEYERDALGRITGARPL
jgi:hypothetical protein